MTLHAGWIWDDTFKHITFLKFDQKMSYNIIKSSLAVKIPYVLLNLKNIPAVTTVILIVTTIIINSEEGSILSTYRARVKASTDEKEDLSHEDGKGQVGVDVVALVTDSTNRSAA